MTTPTSIDPTEVAYYEKLASTWWDRSGPFWPLHLLNAFRLKYIENYLRAKYRCDPHTTAPLQGRRMLDIGCGGGLLSEAMARLGADVHGIDVVERNIHIASLHAQNAGLSIRYEHLTAEALAQQRRQYDIVLNMEVVEHVAHLGPFLEANLALVSPGGTMFIATINRTFRAWLFAKIGAEYILRILPRGTHQWRKFRTPSELRQFLTPAHFDQIETVGVKFNPFAKTFRLTKSLAINYMMVADGRR